MTPPKPDVLYEPWVGGADNPVGTDVVCYFATDVLAEALLGALDIAISHQGDFIHIRVARDRFYVYNPMQNIFPGGYFCQNGIIDLCTGRGIEYDLVPLVFKKRTHTPSLHNDSCRVPFTYGILDCAKQDVIG